LRRAGRAPFRDYGLRGRIAAPAHRSDGDPIWVCEGESAGAGEAKGPFGEGRKRAG
jgi:hypothetical protein